MDSRQTGGVMGAGYTRHATAQHAGSASAYAMLDRALTAVPLPRDGRSFRVADLGCASGVNAMEPMLRVTESVRSRDPHAVIAITHTDIPGNDFNALFAALASPAGHPQDTGVFSYAEARSFYESLFPPGELHLAWSTIAVHWLSRVPQPVPDHIYCSRATGKVREALRRQSAADWSAFLTHRSEELTPGGQLVVAGGAAADDGSSGAEGLMDMAVGELRELVAEGALPPRQFEQMTIPTWNRTGAEFLEVFAHPPVSRVFSLEEAGFVTLPDAAYARYVDGRDAQRYADEVTASFMAAFGPSLFGGRGPAGDSPPVSERFASGLRTRIADRPADARTDWRVQLLRATRRDRRGEGDGQSGVVTGVTRSEQA